MLCCSLSYNPVVVVYMFSQSVAKPADWKYQSGLCSSWATVSCSLNVDMLLPLPNNRTSTGNMEECLKVGTHTYARDLFFSSWEQFWLDFLFQEGLKVWAHQIESGLCLIDGKRLPEDSELTVGQVVNDTWMNECLIAGLGSIICTLLCANQFQHRLLWLDDK